MKEKQTKELTPERKTRLKKTAIIILICAGLLVLGFVIRLIADAVKFNPMASSAPFGVMIILRGFEFLIPAAIMLAVGLGVRKKSFDDDELRAMKDQSLRKREERKEKRAAVPVKVKIRRAVIITVSVILGLLLIMAAAPFIGLNIVINRHISYRGSVEGGYPLQGIWTAGEFGIEENLLTLETSDGEKLWCSEISPAAPDAIVIYVSGIDQPSVTYFYPHAELMLDRNVASFLLELRAHGNSSGKKLGLGYTETEDVRAVLDYIATRECYKDVPVILHGVSMGGATVLNAFGELPEVDAVIAMSAYSSFENELELLMKQYHIPGFIAAYEMIWFKAALNVNFGKDTVASVKPENEIAKANGRPVALIACSGDSSVPYESTLLLSEKCPEAKVWIKDSWEHFIVAECDFRSVRYDTEYCEFVFGFIDDVIKSAK